MPPITRLLALLIVLGTTALPAIAVAENTLAPAAGRFLVAQRGLIGPYFSHSVVYLLQHDATGTLGVIVNRPLGRQAGEVLPDLQADVLGSYPVYTGGPVNPRTVVLLFRGYYPSELALHVAADVYASSNSLVLSRMIRERKPAHELRLFTGSAGWAPGQLARELAQGSWYVTEGDPDAIFSADSDRLWSRLIDKLDPLGILVMGRTLPPEPPRL